MNIDLLLKEREKTLESNKKIPANSKVEELDDEEDEHTDTKGTNDTMSTSISSLIQEPPVQKKQQQSTKNTTTTTPIQQQQYKQTKQVPANTTVYQRTNTSYSDTESESDDDTSIDLQKQQQLKQQPKPSIFKSLFGNILSPFSSSSSSTLQQKLPSFVSYLLLFFILVLYKLPVVDTFLYTYIPQIFEKDTKIYTIQGCIYIGAILTVLYFITIKFF